MNITTEKMTLSHISAVAEIERECFSSPWSENALKEETENPNARFFVAISDGKVVGYGGMHSVLGENYIDNIAVAHTYRRKGVATAILAVLEETAEKEDGIFITLEVRESNTVAINLYEKSGYKRVGTRKKFYTFPTEDAAIMTKELKK